MNRKEYILKLHEIGAIKFGNFTLKSGLKSPFYFDLRDTISHPELLQATAELLVEKARSLDFDYVSGIPYTALPMATLVADKLKKPLIYARKEEKTYGTKNLIIGQYKTGKKCLLIDDLITSGESILETAEKYEASGLITQDFLVLIDRSKNAVEKLRKSGYTLHSLIDMDTILEVLYKAGKIDDKQVATIGDFIKSMEQTDNNPPAANPLTQKLLHIIEAKQSNLVLSLDVDNQHDFFTILKQTAKHIVMLKTHIDILKDYDNDFVPKLLSYAEKYNFLIFEDRKFADIGNTVKKQYQGGMYKISTWSDFITVHSTPGEGILQGLFDGVTGKSSFLLAKMSSKGNLMNDNYTRKTFEMGARYPKIVSGYIVHANTEKTLKRLKQKIPAGQLLLMPGVKLEKGTDGLGQQYTSVVEAVRGGADLIIVGRGIIHAHNPEIMAQQYRETAWQAYLKKI